MRKILAVAMLAAITALGGRAEDPKPEEKKDPFREFKLGEAEFESPDGRLRIEDVRFEEVKLGELSQVSVKFNAKNLTDKPLEAAVLHIALFDEDKNLLDTALAIIQKKENMFDDNMQLPARTAVDAMGGFLSGKAAKAKYWQAALVIGKGVK